MLYLQLQVKCLEVRLFLLDVNKLLTLLDDVHSRLLQLLMLLPSSSLLDGRFNFLFLKLPLLLCCQVHLPIENIQIINGLLLIKFYVIDHFKGHVELLALSLLL
jgi:hypothetical protein